LTALLRDAFFVLGVVCFPVMVLSSLVVMPSAKRFFDVVREQHSGFWVRSGRPWYTLTPRPLRGEHERRAPGGPEDQSYPSSWWLIKTVLSMPEELRGDPDLVKLRARLAPVYWLDLACLAVVAPSFAWMLWPL
jgi:hypothetical protein